MNEDIEFSKQERRCRRLAAKQGLKLIKSRSMTPEKTDWQQFLIADASTGSLNEFRHVWRNLDEVEEILKAGEG